MKKRVTTLLTALLVMMAMVHFNISQATADQQPNSYENEVTREEVKSERPSVTPREATISMLLDAGWTMEEINDWYTEEMLEELDKDALAVSNNTRYIVNYEDEDAGESISEEVSRQEFDYGVNQQLCEKDDHNQTELSTMSSTGVLELQPVYDWTDMDNVTANDRIYFGTSGYSGASIWNADSKCYLKQNMGLVWMANDIYQVQYRAEWKTDPYFNTKDQIGVALATDLIMHTNPQASYTFKYNLRGTEHVETTTSNTYSTKWCTLKSLSMGQGRQLEIKWPGMAMNEEVVIPATKLRTFITFKAKINNKYSYNNFIAYAQYYHGHFNVVPSASIGASTSGANVSFSISVEYAYAVESHPMEVRAKNIYTN